MKSLYIVIVALLAGSMSVSAQVDRHDVRAGNRQFRKENWKEADIDYRKAVVKDSMSVKANYNLANTLYRQGNFDEAAKTMERVKDAAAVSGQAADYWYNTGDIAIAKKDWQGAVNAFREALLRNPGDLEAKENYIYAKKMLENQKGGGGGNGNDDQNQDNQDKNDQNQNGGNNQENQNNQNGQDNKDSQDNQSGDDQKDGGGQNPGDTGQQPVRISPQQAQQMLKAIQAKEKETQDKVNKEKAEALKSRQKDKNW